jgi:tRNA-splicing ligase RtcB
MGCPVGKKRWPADPMPWLFELPPWLRAQFVSGFASADMTTPTLADGRIANLSIKQVADDGDISRFLVRLLDSLGFATGVSAHESAPGRTAYAIQLRGGERAQLRFLEQIGFCHSAERRIAAATAASAAWQRQAVVARRRAASEEARMLSAAGTAQSTVRREVVARHGVTDSFVFHAIYGDRGSSRAPKGLRPEPDASGEVAWVAVESVEEACATEVFDIVTEDPAQAFLAEGIVVHNCGNKAALTDLHRGDLEPLGGVETVMREITRRISFGVGVPAQERNDHPVLDRIRGADFAPQRKLAQLAESQLGTVGSGNHYVNLMADEDDRVWVGVHFGSRGFGHKTASGFLALAQGLPFDGKAHEGEMDSPPVLFEIGSELGESYVSAMELAGEYAYAGRDVVVDKVLEILGARAEHEVHNHHNFAWREEHDGSTYWVIRKGCTPARPGQEGFVGGSMGDESVILEGVESSDSEEALFSTVHGAGRVMSRSQAAGRVKRRKRFVCRNRDCDRITDGEPCPVHPEAGVMKTSVAEQVRPGLVDWPAVQARLRDRGIVLVGGGADEAPEVYKRLPEVLAAHGDTIRVKHTLRPLGVAMAGRDVHDPYKD